MAEKKIILFIVEGISEEAAFGSIMKNFFSTNSVKFEVVHGDITVRDGITSTNAVTKINACINDFARRYFYKKSDFLKIIHLVDTDGAYIDESHILQTSVKSTTYYTDRIETPSKDGLVKRNKQKAEVLNKLIATNSINGLPYKVYYNSCNLEHVICGELKNFTDDEKTEISDNFADCYENDVEGCISFLSSSDIAVPGSFAETWKFIKNDLNSLNRNSNMHLIFTQE